MKVMALAGVVNDIEASNNIIDLSNSILFVANSLSSVHLHVHFGNTPYLM